jgi:amino acid transporter
MARDGVVGEPMGRLHPRFQTPWLAGFAIAGVSLLLFAVSTTVPSINQLMSELIAAIGIQVSFYYATAAFACAWYYRKPMFTDWRLLAFAGIIPLASGLFVASVGLCQLPQRGWRVSTISIGTILIGLLPLWYYRRLYRSPFYTDPPECAAALRVIGDKV